MLHVHLSEMKIESDKQIWFHNLLNYSFFFSFID